MIDLVKASEQCLGKDLAVELRDALVYVDEGAAEAFHFAGGLTIFLQVGVRAVCQLENAASSDACLSWCSEDKPASKIVVLTSKLLSDAHRFILRCIRLHPGIRKLVIYTCISEDAHATCSDTPLGADAFSEYKELLLQDFYSTEPEQQSSVEIVLKHLGLLCCSLTSTAFVLPSSSSIATASLSNPKDRNFLSEGLPGYDDGMPWDEDDGAAPGMVLHAHFLHNLATQLDLKFDVFSLGPVSDVVGKQLSTISSSIPDGNNRRQTVGLLLLDRSLDLVTPACHGDSLVDRIYACLPRDTATKGNENTKNGARYSLQRPSVALRFSSNEDDTEASQPEIIVSASLSDISGSLSSACDFQGLDRLDVLLEKRMKDGAAQVRKWLQDALRQERIEFPEKTRFVVSLNELRSLVSLLLQSPVAAAKHAAIIQLGKAASEVLKQHHASKWEAAAGAERVLSLSATDDLENLAIQVLDLIKQSNSSSSVLSLKDALTVAIVAYGLAGDYTTSEHLPEGPFSSASNFAIKEAIVEAILSGSDDAAALDVLKGLDASLQSYWDKKRDSKPSSNQDDWSDDRWEQWDDDQELADIQLKLTLGDKVDELLGILRRVSAARLQYPLRTILGGPGVFRGLINEVFSLMLAKAEVPGLRHHSSTVGRFLKSGLGRLGIRQTKSKLTDHKVLFVFVIGGLNASEIREARALKGDFEELLVGGTALLTPNDMFNLLFASCAS